MDHVRKGGIPECEVCRIQLASRSHGMKRKRSSNGSQRKDRKKRALSDSSDSEDYDIPSPGVMKVRYLSS
jgi:hypothetical protein